jgi:hypothetical protein
VEPLPIRVRPPWVFPSPSDDVRPPGQLQSAPWILINGT